MYNIECSKLHHWEPWPSKSTCIKWPFGLRESNRFFDFLWQKVSFPKESLLTGRRFRLPPPIRPSSHSRTHRYRVCLSGTYPLCATSYMKSVRYCAFVVGGASCSPMLRMGGSNAVCVIVLCACVRMRGVTNRVIENYRYFKFKKEIPHTFLNLLCPCLRLQFVGILCFLARHGWVCWPRAALRG